MNCYDCAPHHNATAAVAVCHDCGAAVCPDHAVTTDHHLTRMVGLGMSIPLEPAARIVRCTTCAAAVRAASSPHTEAPDTTPVPAGSRWWHHAHH